LLCKQCHEKEFSKKVKHRLKQKEKAPPHLPGASKGAAHGVQRYRLVHNALRTQSKAVLLPVKLLVNLGA
jgi:hypothetical protein